jgi:hypothetical protein
MSKRRRRQLAALDAAYQTALEQLGQVESAFLACCDLFDRLEAIRPGSRVSEATIRKILHAAADHVFEGGQP